MKNTPDILQKIILRKREEIRERSAEIPLESLLKLAGNGDSPRGFAQAIADRTERGLAAVVAEIKKSSPSKG